MQVLGAIVFLLFMRKNLGIIFGGGCYEKKVKGRYNYYTAHIESAA